MFLVLSLGLNFASFGADIPGSGSSEGAQTSKRSSSTKKSSSKTLSPPFEFTAERVKTTGTRFVVNNQIVEKVKQLTTITCRLNSDGTLSGNYKVVSYNYPMGDYGDFTAEEYVDTDRPIEGTWSTDSRSLGNGREKCYVINVSFLTSTYYLPVSSDYLFKGWLDCNNNKTGDAFKVVSKKNL